MIDLHGGVAALFAEAQHDRAEPLGDGFIFFARAIPCSACGLTDFYHQRFGCRPPVVGPFVHLKPDAVVL